MGNCPDTDIDPIMKMTFRLLATFSFFLAFLLS